MFGGGIGGAGDICGDGSVPMESGFGTSTVAAILEPARTPAGMDMLTLSPSTLMRQLVPPALGATNDTLLIILNDPEAALVKVRFHA